MTRSRKQAGAEVRRCRRPQRAIGKSVAIHLLRGLSFATAVVLCGETASAGYVEGMEAFSRGDYIAAYDELRPVAEGGDANAQFTLGFMYDYGQGVRQSTIEAIWWYRKAAEQGLAVAQFTLGSIFEAGRGTTKDPVEAYRWYSLAAETLPPGDIRTTVAERRDLIGASLSPSQFQEAQELLASQGASAQAAVPTAPAQESRAPVNTTADVDHRLLVAEIQAELARLGYDVGRGDGNLDDITIGAIKAFEYEQGQEMTGTPSSELLQLLRSAEGLAPAAAPQELPSQEAAAEASAASDAESAPAVEASPEVAVTETAIEATADEATMPTPPAMEAEVVEEAVAAEIAPEEVAEAVAPVPAEEVLVAAEEPVEESVEATTEAPEELADPEPVEVSEPAAAPAEQQIAAVESETDALPEETPAVQPETAAPSGPPVELVRDVQTELTRLGYRIGLVDGVHGRRTKGAIEDFQATHGLAVTGQVSEELLARLAAANPAVLPLPDEPDPATLARRETLDQQLGSLRAITETVDGPAAAMPGWGQLEVWEIETAELLRTRFGPNAAEGLAKQRKDLVLGDPYGNFQRTAEAYRVYLAVLRQDLE